MKNNIGRKIKFRLDNNTAHEGTGKITHVFSEENYDVRLDHNLKEYHAGMSILVGKNEIIEFLD